MNFNNVQIEIGFQCAHYNPPSWMWGDQCVVVGGLINGWAIVECEMKRGKGYATTLAIVPTVELTAQPRMSGERAWQEPWREPFDGYTNDLFMREALLAKVERLHELEPYRKG